MVSLGYLEIGLALNKNQFDADLRRAKNDLERLSLNNLGKITIKPTVDHRELYLLNKHLDLKEAHFNRLNQKLKQNPLTVRTNTEALSQLEKQLKELKALGSDFKAEGRLRLIVEQKPIKSDIYSNIRDVTGLIKESNNLLRTITKNTAKQGLIGNIVSAPFKALSTTIKGVFEGFGQEIGNTIARDTLTKPTKIAISKTKSAINTINEVLIGNAQVYETFASELLRSGDISKAAKSGFDRTKLAAVFERLAKLQEIALIPSDKPKQRMAAINKDPELKKFYEQAVQEISQSPNNLSRGEKLSAVLDRFLALAQPTEPFNKVVNPLIKELAPFLNFIQGMRAYRTSFEAQKYYNKRKAGFPILGKEEDIVNVIGGAQFKGGQGGRQVALSLEMLAPQKRFIPVENIESDTDKFNPRIIEKLFIEKIEEFFSQFAGNEILNTAVNALRQVIFSINPVSYSTAAAQSIANTRLAQEQGKKGSAVSFSLGGSDAIEYSRTARYLGIESKALAMNYPFLNFTKNTPNNFKSFIAKGDPLTFASLLGLGYPSKQGQTLDVASAFGLSLHHQKHLFKNLDFIKAFFETINSEIPDISAENMSGIVHAGDKLYEIIGAARQLDSLLTTGQFNVNDPYKRFLQEYQSGSPDITTSYLIAKLGESTSVVKGLKGTPATEEIGRRLEQLLLNVLDKVQAKFRQSGAKLPKNLEKDFAGYQKYQEDVGQINKAFTEFKTGKIDPSSPSWWGGNLDPNLVKLRTSGLKTETVPWFRKDGGQFGAYQQKLVEAYSMLSDVAEEFVKTNGKLSQETKEKLKLFEVDTFSEDLNQFLKQRLNTDLLPSEETVRTLQVEIPGAFKKVQSAILAYNKLLDALGADVLPSIQELKKVAHGMSGAAALISEKLVYKTDLDPEGATKIGSEQEIKAYERLQGRFSPLLYKAVPGQALITERIEGRSLKEILNRIARPYKTFYEQRQKLIQQLKSLEDEKDIDKTKAEIKELSLKIRREQNRFNKASGILYEQVGRLAATLQAMGVVHNDLASGNVFFTSKGVTSIDLGNAQVVPKGQKNLGWQQKLIDNLTTNQRGIIDSTYYGLLNPVNVVASVGKGLFNPYAIPEKRSIDSNLLNPINKGSAIPLGSINQSLLWEYLGFKPNYKTLAGTEINQPFDISEEFSATALNLPTNSPSNFTESSLIFAMEDLQKAIEELTKAIRNQNDDENGGSGGSIKAPKPSDNDPSGGLIPVSINQPLEIVEINPFEHSQKYLTATIETIDVFNQKIKQIGAGIQALGKISGSAVAPLIRAANGIEAITFAAVPLLPPAKKAIQSLAPIGIGAIGMGYLPEGISSGAIELAQAGMNQLTGFGASSLANAINPLIESSFGGIPFWGSQIAGNLTSSISGLLGGGAQTLGNLGGSGLALWSAGKIMQNAAMFPFNTLNKAIFTPEITTTPYYGEERQIEGAASTGLLPDYFKVGGLKKAATNLGLKNVKGLKKEEVWAALLGATDVETLQQELLALPPGQLTKQGQAALKGSLVAKPKPDANLTKYFSERYKQIRAAVRQLTEKAASESITADVQLLQAELENLETGITQQRTALDTSDIGRQINGYLSAISQLKENLQNIVNSASNTVQQVTRILQAGDIARVNLEELTLDPNRFQYKLNPTKTGSTGSLTGVQRWDEDLDGVVSVWRDPKDGRLYVVNGHNRITLAQNLNVKEITVRLLSASSAGEARSKGALINIAEGRGTALDAAKFLRDQKLTTKEQLKQFGIPLKDKIATQGLSLAQLPAELFQRVALGQLSESRGISIGGSGLKEFEQRELLKLIEQAEKRGRKINEDIINELVDTIKSSINQTVEQLDLFGASTEIQSLALSKAEIQGLIKKRLSREKKLFGLLGRSGNAQELSKTGNVIRTEENAEIAQKADIALTVFDQLKNLSSPIADLLNQAAQDAASGLDLKKAVDKIYPKILELIPELARGSTIIGQSISEGLGQGLFDNVIDVAAAAKELGRTPEKVVRKESETQSPSKRFILIGKEVVKGLTIGLKNGTGELAQAAKLIAKTLIEETKKTLQISSPSKVFEEIGKAIVEGEAIGIEKNSDRILTLLEKLNSEIIEEAQSAEILERIGRGVFGTTYRVKGTNLALKYGKIQEQESLTAAQISSVSNYAPKVYGANPKNLLMEYFPGDVLAEKMKTFSGDLNNLLKELLKARLEIFQAGYLHDDMHSRNILLNDENQIKVVDFGFTRKREGKELDLVREYGFLKIIDNFFKGIPLGRRYQQLNTYQPPEAFNSLKGLGKEKNRVYAEAFYKALLENIDLFEAIAKTLDPLKNETIFPENLLKEFSKFTLSLPEGVSKGGALSTEFRNIENDFYKILKIFDLVAKLAEKTRTLKSISSNTQLNDNWLSLKDVWSPLRETIEVKAQRVQDTESEQKTALQSVLEFFKNIKREIIQLFKATINRQLRQETSFTRNQKELLYLNPALEGRGLHSKNQLLLPLGIKGGELQVIPNTAREFNNLLKILELVAIAAKRLSRNEIISNPVLITPYKETIDVPATRVASSVQRITESAFKTQASEKSPIVAEKNNAIEEIYKKVNSQQALNTGGGGKGGNPPPPTTSNTPDDPDENKRKIEKALKDLEQTRNQIRKIKQEIDKELKRDPINQGQQKATQTRDYWQSVLEERQQKIKQFMQVLENEGAEFAPHFVGALKVFLGNVDALISQLPTLGTTIKGVDDAISALTDGNINLGKAVKFGIGAFALFKTAEFFLLPLFFSFQNLPFIVQDSIGQSLNLVKELEQVEVNFKIANVSNTEAEIQRLIDKSDELGISFRASLESYARFKTVAVNSPLEVQSAQIFEGFQAGLAARLTNPEQQRETFRAVTQIASRPKVSLEEFTQQLTESGGLNDALIVAARSMGLTTQEFYRQAEAGNILSEDLLPRLANQYNLLSQSALASSTKPLQARLNILQNQIEKVSLAFGQLITPATKIGVSSLNQLLKILTDNFELIAILGTGATLAGLNFLRASIFQFIAGVRGGTVAVALLKTSLELTGVGATKAGLQILAAGTTSATGFQLVALGAKAAVTSIAGIALAIAPWVAATAVIYGLFKVFTAGTKEIKEALKVAKEVEKSIDNLQKRETRFNAPQDLTGNRFTDTFAFKPEIKTDSLLDRAGLFFTIPFNYLTKSWERFNSSIDISNTDKFLESAARSAENLGKAFENPEAMQRLNQELTGIRDRITSLRIERLKILDERDVNNAAQVQTKLTAIDQQITKLQQKELKLIENTFGGNASNLEALIQQLEQNRTNLLLRQNSQDPVKYTEQLLKIENLLRILRGYQNQWNDAIEHADYLYQKLASTILKIDRILANVAYSTQENLNKALINLNRQFAEGRLNEYTFNVKVNEAQLASNKQKLSGYYDSIREQATTLLTELNRQAELSASEVVGKSGRGRQKLGEPLPKVSVSVDDNLTKLFPELREKGLTFSEALAQGAISPESISQVLEKNEASLNSRLKEALNLAQKYLGLRQQIYETEKEAAQQEREILIERKRRQLQTQRLNFDTRLADSRIDIIQTGSTRNRQTQFALAQLDLSSLKADLIQAQEELKQGLGDTNEIKGRINQIRISIAQSEASIREQQYDIIKAYRELGNERIFTGRDIEILNQYPFGGVISAYESAQNELARQEKRLQEAYWKQAQGIEDPIDIQREILETEKAVAQARASLIQSEMAVTEYWINLYRQAEDFNIQVRSFQRSLEDAAINSAREVRGLQESYDDLVRELGTSLRTVQNQLKDAQDRLKTQLARNEFYRGLPLGITNNLYRQVTDTVFNIIEQFQQNRSEGRQLQNQADEITTQYISTMRRIRDLQEQQLDIERNRLRTMEDLLQSQIQLNRTMEDLIRALQKELGYIPNLGLQAIPQIQGQNIPETYYTPITQQPLVNVPVQGGSSNIYYNPNTQRYQYNGQPNTYDNSGLGVTAPSTGSQKLDDLLNNSGLNKYVPGAITQPIYNPQSQPQQIKQPTAPLPQPQPIKQPVTTAPLPQPQQINLTGRAQIILSWGQNLGFSPAGLAATLGNFRQEGTDNGIIFNPYALNENSGAYGIAQWLNSRKTALNKRYPRTGNMETDLRNQLNFAQSELSPQQIQRLRSAKTVDEAMRVWNEFERWSGWQNGRGGREAGNRYRYAEEYLRQFGNQSSVVPGIELGRLAQLGISDLGNGLLAPMPELDYEAPRQQAEEIKKIREETLQIEQQINQAASEWISIQGVDQLRQINYSITDQLRQAQKNLRDSIISTRELINRSKGYLSVQEQIRKAGQDIANEYDNQIFSLRETLIQNQRLIAGNKEQVEALRQVVAAQTNPEVRAELEKTLEILQIATQEYSNQNQLIEQQLNLLRGNREGAVSTAESRTREDLSVDKQARELELEARLAEAQYNRGGVQGGLFNRAEVLREEAAILRERLQLTRDLKLYKASDINYYNQMLSTFDQLSKIRLEDAFARANPFISAFEQGLTSIITQSESAGEALRNLGLAILNVFTQQLVVKPLARFLGTAFGGIFGFAKGGEVDSFNNFALGGEVTATEIGHSAIKAFHRERMLGGGQPVLAALTVGEYVVPRNEVPDYLAYKEEVNSLSDKVDIKNFAGGGYVGNVKYPSPSKTTNNNNVNRSVTVNNNTEINLDSRNDLGYTLNQIHNRNEVDMRRAQRRLG